MVKEIVLGTLKTHNLVYQNQHIVLGLSGGPDSVCLFHILIGLTKKWNLAIHPVHVNHKFRPGAAEEDQAFVEKLCKDNGLECYTVVADCPKIAMEEHKTTEEVGRLVRYKAFSDMADRLCEKGIAKEDIVIAVAQNADDQAETILFRILRGTGTDGVSGVRYSRTDEKGYKVVRPLLDVPKKDILDYCGEHNLHPCIDKTNDDRTYTRNRIRHDLLPYLEDQFNPNVREAIIKLGKSAGEDRDCLWSMASEVFDKVLKERDEEHVLLDGSMLREVPRALRRRVMSKALEDIGLQEDVTFVHFEKASEILSGDKPSARLDLPGGYYVTRQYGDLKFVAPQKTGSPPELKYRVTGREQWDHIHLQKDTFCAFDYDKLICRGENDFLNMLKCRFREPGDFIDFGHSGRKKIQDYFVDSKVPKDCRDKIPLVAVGREILWIKPLSGKCRYSAKYSIDSTTKNVIYIEITC